MITHRWDLAFISNSIDDLFNGKEFCVRHVINPYKDRWFADPFILSFDNDVIELLVEEYNNDSPLGRISRIVINRNRYEIQDLKVVLQFETHLSFPAIMRKDGKIYIYPENSCAGGLWLYEYNQKTDECKKIKKLSNQPLTDAIITDLFGKKQLFSTKEPNPNKNVLDIYDWDDEKDYFEFRESFMFEENLARNAGAFFEHKGRKYRPAQECNVMYGHSVSLQEVDITDNGYLFKEVRRLMPPKGACGIHTFNSYNGLTVIDMKVFLYPRIAMPLFKLRNLFKNAR